jgi:hypothetical protein
VTNYDLFLAIIGPHWCQILDEQGRRLIDRSDDFVHIEIDLALRRGNISFPSYSTTPIYRAGPIHANRRKSVVHNEHGLRWRLSWELIQPHASGRRRQMMHDRNESVESTERVWCLAGKWRIWANVGFETVAAIGGTVRLTQCEHVAE